MSLSTAPRSHIFVIGDSISQGYGPALACAVRGFASYSRKEEQDPALTPDERAHPMIGSANGGDSSAVFAYLKRKLAQPDFAPDLLVVNCGLHDIRVTPDSPRHQVPLADYRANVRAILALIRARNLRPVWVLTTPVDDAIHQARETGFRRYNADVLANNRSAVAICGAFDCPVIDLYTFTANLPGDLYADHVHFTPEVSARQGAYIAGALAVLFSHRG